MWTLLLNRWVLIGIAFAFVSAYAGIEHWRAWKWEKQFYTFQAEVKVLGEEAKKKAKETEARDKLATQQAHDDLQTKLDSLTSDNQRLRDANARKRFLPAPTNPSKPTDRACFSRQELESAIGEFAGGLTELAQEGDQGIAKAEAWRQWWEKVSR